MFGHRASEPARKDAAKKPVLVDLSGYEVKGDTSVMRMKAVSAVEARDISVIRTQIDNGNIIFINLSEFAGTPSEKEELVTNTRSYCRSVGVQSYIMNDSSIVVVPNGVKLDKVRARRKDPQ